MQVSDDLFTSRLSQSSKANDVMEYLTALRRESR